MKQRTLRSIIPALAILLALSLAAAACGTTTSDTSAGVGGPAGPDGTDRPTTTVVAPGRGWLEGEDLDWSSRGSGSDGGAVAAEAYAVESSADGEGADSSASSSELSPIVPPIEPPIDDSPLRAGSIDDGDNVQAFLDYRKGIVDSGMVVRPLDLRDSTVFTVLGNNGLPVLDAMVELWDPTADRSVDVPVVTLRTAADGSVRFSPAAMAQAGTGLAALVRVGDVVTDADYRRGDPAVTVTVDVAGGIDGSVPLDVLFVLDATGSMGDEISRLRENMIAIAEQIDVLPSAPDVRFGMTVYRDEGDVFVTRTFDFTDDLDEFLDALADVQADGGGDYPEALDKALADALEKPAWRGDGTVQLMFLVADAPPHVEREVQQPYTATAIAAAEVGVKIFPVAASGSDDQAEYVMRELAFVTGGRFVFLSYGAGGAATGDRTDISADDYDELPLDQLVVRLVQDELAALAGETGQTATTTTTTTVPVTTTTYEQ
jgi:von Willebrand factor type A domain-containing protein